MACKLTKVAHPPFTFSGPAGQDVTLTVTGTAAVITSVNYDGQPLPQQGQPAPPPWTFTIKPGRKVLVVIVVNQPGDLTRINEKCNGTANLLQELVFDDAFPRVFFIQGT
ncbi:MAG TPA: hypothetical protein VMW75_08985 [Thermoanaerobaculia bacterium]|nr:hypothetical protein [Thermoanaerobaculia bacterium]